jgi:hypothetical protein
MRFYLEKWLAPVMGVVLLALAYRAYQWQGVALVVSGGLLWALLHYTRMIKILGQAAKKPMGYVDSAVMLNAKLREGLTLLQVIEITRSLGQKCVGFEVSTPTPARANSIAHHNGEGAELPRDQGREWLMWSDHSDCRVECQFNNGRLSAYQLIRPLASAESRDTVVSSKINFQN